MKRLKGLFTPEFKKRIIRKYMEGDCSYKILAAECGVSKTTIFRWYRKYSLECQTDSETGGEHDSIDEVLRLKKENEELRNEAAFLKKVVAIFAKETA